MSKCHVGERKQKKRSNMKWFCSIFVVKSIRKVSINRNSIMKIYKKEEKE